MVNPIKKVKNSSKIAQFCEHSIFYLKTTDHSPASRNFLNKLLLFVCSDIIDTDNNDDEIIFMVMARVSLYC